MILHGDAAPVRGGDVRHSRPRWRLPAKRTLSLAVLFAAMSLSANPAYDPARSIQEGGLAPGAIVILVISAGALAVWNWSLRRKLQAAKQETSTDDGPAHTPALQSDNGILTFSRDGAICGANESAADLLHIDKAKLLEMSITDIIDPEDLKQEPIRYDLLDACICVRTERRMRQIGGRQPEMEICATRLPDGRYQAIMRDITRSKAAERELLKTKALLQSSLQQCPIGVMLFEHPSGKTIFANDAALAIARESKESFLSMDFSMINRLNGMFYELDGTPCPFDRTPTAIAALNGETVNDRQLIIHYPDSVEKVISAGAAPVKDGAGRVFATITVFTDITESKNAETLLKRRTDALHTIFENISLGIVLVRPDLRISTCNRRFTEMLGLPESSSETHPEFDKAIDCWIADANPSQEELDRVRRDILRRDVFSREFILRGRVIEVRHCPLPDGGFIRTQFDITDRKNAEQSHIRHERETLHKQKLESLGLLAGGIAHDFNNLLLAILGNLELAKLLTEGGNQDIRRRLSDAESAALRAADLTKQLLAYSGKGKVQIKPFNISDSVSEMLSLLNVSIPKNATLKLHLASGIPAIKGDAVQIQQVIMNLIVNAGDALEGRPGRIDISTGVAVYDDLALSASRLLEKPRAGAFAFLKVGDDGCGMDENTQNRIFEPFFTTKPNGRGLGMSTVIGIMQSHGGAVLLESRKDAGSAFTILFPIQGDAAQAVADQKTQKATSRTHPRMSGCVLVIDDESMIRELCAAILAKTGMKTLLAADGAEALAKFTESRGQIDCVLLDVSMPGMDGPTVFKKLKEVDPSAKIALSSGYSREDVSKRFAGLDFAGFIQKPFQIDEFAKTMREIIRA